MKEYIRHAAFSGFFILFALLPMNYVSAQIAQSEVTSSAERKIKLSWEEVEGAISYKILIMNAKGNLVADKQINVNNIIIEAPAGSYKIRIGAINKFGKIGSWSDWADFSIEAPALVQKPLDEKKEEDAKLSYSGLKIGLGWSYFYILPDWAEYYKNSYTAFSADISYSFRKLNFPGFLRYAGVDAECTYVKFKGEKAFNRVESNLTDIIYGGNIFFSTNFNFPLNFAIRGGGGYAYSALEYQRYDNFGNPTNKGTTKTSAYYYKAGASIEYRIFQRVFFEVYTDYYNINYLVRDFRTLRIACFAGIRL
ncbi:MAG: hypothetical protein V1874_13905 [Spirochaetota bacterium]